MPLTRSLADTRREITEKKWEEAKAWAEDRIAAKKYRMPRNQRSNGIVAGCPKRLTRRYHQLRTGHCITGQYLQWTRNCDTAECGWCHYKTQTREHLFKNCPQWKKQ